MNNRRVEWLDVAKGLGIFAIYLGHCGAGAGLSLPFVFSYHVGLFFLVSGCVESMASETCVREFLKKKVKGLLIPYFVFALLSVGLEMIKMNYSIGTMKYFLVLVGQGAIRDTLFAGSLWFLTCLFSMSIVFKLLERIPWKSVILLACLGMYLIANTVIQPHPLEGAHWIFNLDSMMYYIIFYAIGYVCFPGIQRLFESGEKQHRLLFLLGGMIALGYSGLLFFEMDLLKGLESMSVVGIFVPLVRSMLVIWLHLSVAYVCRNVPCFQELGRVTLYLCGGEYIVKTLAQSTLALAGLALHISSPLVAYIYTAIMLYLAYKYVVPMEKRLVNAVLCAANKK